MCLREKISITKITQGFLHLEFLNFLKRIGFDEKRRRNTILFQRHRSVSKVYQSHQSTMCIEMKSIGTNCERNGEIAAKSANAKSGVACRHLPSR